MRSLQSVGLALLAFAASGAPGSAEDFAKAALPDTVACPQAIADITTCYAARHSTASYLLAAMPKDWNGKLIVFAHGGPYLEPPKEAQAQLDLAKYSIAVKLGFAWVASSYRREGYGVRMAAEDTDLARRFFFERIGRPTRTILHGASYGGLVGARLLETYAKNPDGSLNYDGAFFNSGLVAGVPLAYEFRVDLRAIYQYYCKNLPRPDEPQYPLWSGVALDSKMTLKDLETLVDECTGVLRAPEVRSEAQRQNLANITGVMGFSEKLLYRHMQSSTLLFRNIVQLTTNGRNPFSNVGVQYRGSDNDAVLNRDVSRFTADADALAQLRADGQPTGTIPVPIVSIHSINDPQVAVEQQSVFRSTVDGAGSGALLVQAFTDEPVHTGQSTPEIAAAIDALMLWIEKSEKPSAQSIATACEGLRAALSGPCRYHPDFAPKPYSTRYYTRDTAIR
jgi:GNAT superfamily N-acetyltransferase